MILDTIQNAERYFSIHPLFETAFRFLKESDLESLPAGRNEFDAEDMYANVDDVHGKSRSNARLEAHRRFIDIQFVVRGRDEIGILPLQDCRQVSVEYEDARDIGFFADSPRTWLCLDPGMFAIFFPTDAHAPLAGEGPLRKIVVKVPIK